MKNKQITTNLTYKMISTKKLLIFAYVICFFSTLLGQSQISVAKFGAIANDTINDREAIQQAVSYSKTHNVKKLIIPAGKYIISDEKAIQLMHDIMNGKMGRNPQDIVYTPYYSYTKGIHFSGIKNLEIDATGATFSVRGWMEPVSIENCKHLTIKGLSIDYETQPHSEGLVVNEGDGFFDVKFSNEFIPQGNMILLRIMFWDLKRNRLLGNSLYFPKKHEMIDMQTVRIHTSYPTGIKGKMALINHTFHFRPAVLINASDNTKLLQVTIHTQPGMGIVGHRSENILLKEVNIVPREGCYQSTNTDATHFTSCKGLLRIDGCKFKGQGDDATNVHGYYQQITQQLAAKTYSIEMEKQWGTHAMVLDYPDKGDKLELVSKKTLQVIGTYTVKVTQPQPEKWNTIITLNNALPNDIENYYLIDVTRLPRLEFVNCEVNSHLARAVLVKTRNVLIENCTLRESTGSAIHIGAEGDWREGPGSANIIIRNNHIIRCGSGDGANNGASGIAINAKAPNPSCKSIHKNILIEGNTIEGENSECGISVNNATGVIIRKNNITACKEKVIVNASQNVTIDDKE